MWMKRLTDIIMKIKDNVIFMSIVYLTIILILVWIFIFKPPVKINFIYNEF